MTLCDLCAPVTSNDDQFVYQPCMSCGVVRACHVIPEES